MAHPEQATQLAHRQRTGQQVLEDVAMRVPNALEARRVQRFEHEREVIWTGQLAVPLGQLAQRWYPTRAFRRFLRVS